MFKTHIDGKEVKVEFQHQRAAYRGQLTRPEVRKVKKKTTVVRVPVYANCFCFFGELCVGLSFCSYSDEKRYSKGIGRQVALKNALKSVLKRSGRKDHDVAEERAQVWEDYFRARKVMGTSIHPLVVERTIRRMQEARLRSEFTMLTEIPAPMPTDSDAPSTSIPWRLGGHSMMSDEAIAHLNEEDANTQ